MSDQIKITVIATGFDSVGLRQFQSPRFERQEEVSQQGPSVPPSPGEREDEEDEEGGSQYDIPAFLRGN